MIVHVPVLLITGPPGAGKTTVATLASDLLGQRGVAHAVCSLDELDRRLPGGPGSLHFKNLACVWSNYAASGVARLVVEFTLDSPSDLDRLREAVPGADVRVCRLAAEVATLVDRVTRREPPYLQEHLAELARRNARLMGDWRPEDYLVDNDRRSLGAVVRDVVDGSGWLSGPTDD